MRHVRKTSNTAAHRLRRPIVVPDTLIKPDTVIKFVITILASINAIPATRLSRWLWTLPLTALHVNNNSISDSTFRYDSMLLNSSSGNANSGPVVDVGSNAISVFVWLVTAVDVYLGGKL